MYRPGSVCVHIEIHFGKENLPAGIHAAAEIIAVF